MKTAAILWLLAFCHDDCRDRESYNVEVCHNKGGQCDTSKTACEASRTELMDQAAHQNRFVWTRCFEWPTSQHFNYIEEHPNEFYKHRGER